jgi:hypothetical protein
VNDPHPLNYITPPKKPRFSVLWVSVTIVSVLLAWYMGTVGLVLIVGGIIEQDWNAVVAGASYVGLIGMTFFLRHRLLKGRIPKIQ